jgi:TolB-like protein
MILKSKFSINLLGNPSVHAPDGSARQIRTQKALGLLALIATAGASGMTRERAAGMLWSRSPEPQARTNLRQALASLKKSLRPGVNILRSSGPVLFLCPDHAVSDIDRLSASTDPTDPAARRDFLLSAGVFLDGIAIDEPDFEDWLAGERTHYRALRISAMFALTDTCIGEGELDGALALARGLLSADNYDEAAHRLAMQVYLARDEPVKALQQFNSMETVLLSELGIQPSAASRDLKEQIRSPVPVRTEMADASGEKPTLVVLPFRSLSDDPDHRYFSAGLAEDITTQLSRFSTLTVIARHNTGLVPSEPDDMARIGRDLGAHYVVVGSVRWIGARVRISAQLVEVASGAQIWAERFDRQPQDLFEVQDEVTGRIAAALPGRLQDDVAERAARKPVDRLKAYELLLRGKVLRDSLSLAGNRQARKLLEQALKIDETVARAHMYLSDTYVVDCWFGVGDDNARALALSHARRAVALDGTDVYIQDHLGFAFHCSKMWDDAEIQIDKALAKIENEIESKAWCGYALLMFGQRDRARAVIQEVAERRSTLPAAFDWISGQLHSLDGRYEEAVGALMGEALLNALSRAFLTGAYARLGRSQDAERALAEFVTMRRQELSGHFDGTCPATVTALAGGFRDMWRRQSDWEHIAEGLRMAGLPD